MHLRTLWLKANRAKNVTSSDWMLSPSRTTSSRRGNPMVLGTVKLKHINSTISPLTRGRHVAKELTVKKNITKEFTIVFYETQYIVICNSKLGGPSRSASKWINWHRKTTPTIFQRRIPEMSKTLVCHFKQIGQKRTDATSIRLPSHSHNHEPSPPRSRRRKCRNYSL